ncbi:uncharacterized protein A4U43_C01F10660 [Asparagus officinalis]|uniref:Uncharacterized protein n=1 Tax=Asparagus officinalis TaxID=4686 RepID=A0A5P1FT34_ASPOF|nr:uncharacterized protein LOC109821109 [Asparagus officinalis]ONK79840.1 uncharacterized protein A4U43_C01F10660 [Asparagus officinalis]
MDLPQETDDYIRESIQHSLGLPISSKTLQLKLLASEDDRHRLQDQIFLLQDRLNESQKRVDLYKAEAAMNAQGLRKCVEDKEAMVVEYENLSGHCSKLEKECMLYERDFEKIMESCDELAKENEELRARIEDDSSTTALATEVESLQKDKEHLRVNLLRAEEEVKVLFEENKLLEEENKRLVRQLHRERNRQGSETKPSSCKPSGGASSKGKRKSSLSEGRLIDFDGSDSPRQPLSLLHQNSPDSSKMHKK